MKVLAVVSVAPARMLERADEPRSTSLTLAPADSNNPSPAPHDLRRLFNELMETHGAAATAYARKLVGDAHAAEDLVQDAFVALYKNAERYDWTSTDPRSLIYKTLSRRASNFRRNRRVRNERYAEDLSQADAGGDAPAWEQAVADPKAAQPDEELAQREEAGQAAKLLAQLPEKQRMALHLKVNEGLSYKEIGEALEESVDNVGLLIYRAKQGLRALMAAQAGD